jgi:DNA adenine methylase
MSLYNRPFLKWAGGKYRLLPSLIPLIGHGECLIEPFVGAGAVFLNTQFKHYILNDNNTDLIHLYQTLQQKGRHFVNYAKAFFVPENNTAERYYHLRDRFNHCKKSMEKAALFLYLNRYGYNGLCRYSSKGFNVPFGSYKQPLFPEDSLLFFHEKSQHAEFIAGDFTQIMQKATKKHVIYCDPPYLPLDDTHSFTQYKLGFTLEQQHHLALLAKQLNQQHGTKIILSNHDTQLARQLYNNAHTYKTIDIRRVISCKTEQRNKIREMIAIFG